MRARLSQDGKATAAWQVRGVAPPTKDGQLELGELPLVASLFNVAARCRFTHSTDAHPGSRNATVERVRVSEEGSVFI